MNGYERVERGKKYYYAYDDVVFNEIEKNDEYDDEYYENVNYYSDEIVAENNVRADWLLRRLRRFAVENNEDKIDWNDYDQNKYCIYFDYHKNKLNLDFCDYCRDLGQIYFTSEDTAKRAIKVFEDDLKWYFTKYCNHAMKVFEKESECKYCNNNARLHSMKKIGFEFCPKCGKRIEV